MIHATDLGEPRAHDANKPPTKGRLHGSRTCTVGRGGARGRAGGGGVSGKWFPSGRRAFSLGIMRKSETRENKRVATQRREYTKCH